MNGKNKQKISTGGFALTTVLMLVALMFVANNAHANFFDELSEVLETAKSNMDKAQVQINNGQKEIDEANLDAIKAADDSMLKKQKGVASIREDD